MPEFLFYILITLCLSLVVHGLKDTARVMEFPFFIAVTVLGFMGPQILSLIIHTEIMPRDVLSRGIYMTILCVLMSWLGYKGQVKAKTLSHWVFPSRHEKLVIWALIYGVFSVLMYWRVRQLAAGLDESITQWSGSITKYYFFSQSNMVALTIALLAYFRKTTMPMLILVLFCSIPLLHRIYIGRRADFFMLFAIAGCSLYFIRGYKPPRWSVVLLAVIGFLVVFTIGEYRRIVKDGGLPTDRSSQLALKQELESRLAIDKYEMLSETGIAYFLIEASRQAKYHEYGSIFWNRVVHGLVPAQFIGAEFKQALKLGDEKHLERFMYVQMGVEIPIGHTKTGIGTAYAQFGYFGCFIFFLIGRCYRYMWEAVKVPENEIMRVVYPGMVVFGMHVVTHNVGWYSDHMIYYAIFLALPYLHSRIPARIWRKHQQQATAVGAPVHAAG